MDSLYGSNILELSVQYERENVLKGTDRIGSAIIDTHWCVDCVAEYCIRIVGIAIVWMWWLKENIVNKLNLAVAYFRELLYCWINLNKFFFAFFFSVNAANRVASIWTAFIIHRSKEDFWELVLGGGGLSVIHMWGYTVFVIWMRL